MIGRIPCKNKYSYVEIDGTETETEIKALIAKVDKYSAPETTGWFEVPNVPIPDAPPSIEPPTSDCPHANVSPMSGTGKKGPWVGQRCEDCGSVRFQNKRAGVVSWGEWQEKKK